MTAPFDDAGEAARYTDYLIRQRHEYGTWVAAENIPVDGVLAFLAGHPVPASTVEKHGWDRAGLVVAADTPAPDPAAVAAAQKRERLAQLDAERAALAAELGDTTEPESGHPGDDSADPPEGAGRAPASPSRRRGAQQKEQ